MGTDDRDAPLTDEQVLALIRREAGRPHETCVRCGTSVLANGHEQCDCAAIDRCLSDLVALRGAASEMAAREETHLLKIGVLESDLVAARRREQAVRERLMIREAELTQVAGSSRISPSYRESIEYERLGIRTALAILDAPVDQERS